MKKNMAISLPFVLWAVLFIAVPLAMVVWYGVTVEETPAYVEVAGDNGQTLFQLEDGTVTVRHRDTMEQERVLIESLPSLVDEECSYRKLFRTLNL